LLGMCCSSCLLQQACCEGFPFPNLQCSGHPALFAMCLFCCYCLFFSFFSFFPWVGVSLSRGLCWPALGCLWEYHVPLSSLCGPHLPTPSVVRKPSRFLCLTWGGDALRSLEVWRSQSFASSRWFFL
jgi:hypothetical protein